MVQFVAGLTLIVATIVPVGQASATPITARSVTLGSSLPSADTTHSFNFTLASSGTLGSIVFEYCTNTPFIEDSCLPPVDFSAIDAQVQSQSGETGFTKGAASTVNRIVLTRSPVANAAIPVSYTFEEVINQSATNSPSYVRISTYASDDASGAAIDNGAVAYSTAPAIAVGGYVPPYITFCVGVTVALNCSESVGSQLNFGELSSTGPRVLTSQFSVATNDPAGYTTFVAGPTMTSGSNVIPGLGSPQFSQPGSSQFGMNLRSNSNPVVGADPAGVGTGVISANFNNPNQFFFGNQVIAASPLPTDFNAFTVSYLININRNQQPGIYVTTLTYIASAAF